MRNLKEEIDSLIKVVEKKKAELDYAKKEETKLTLIIKDKREEHDVLVQVAELFKSMGGMQQEDLLEKLESFVSYGLASVFGSGYRFKTLCNYEGKDLRVDFRIETDDLETGVAEARGGGLVEVVGILLHLFFLMFKKDEAASFLVLDAGLLHLSDLYKRRMSQLLQELSNKLGVQILLLAHSEDFGSFADVLYRFEQKDGKTIAYKEK